MSVLQVTDLAYAYAPQKRALDGISFEMMRGEVTALLGPNGAGKSTLFALATHLLSARQGTIVIDGQDIDKNPRVALGKLGVVFQQTTLDLDLSVQQNLRYAASLHGLSRKLANQRIEEELKRLDMFERRSEKVRLLNGGHKRRVEIARALLHEPDILLLDEATVGLDVPSRKAIVDHVHQLAKDKQIGVLWATHLIDEISAQDKVIILHQGQIKAQAYAQDLSEEYTSVEQAFAHFTQKGDGP